MRLLFITNPYDAESHIALKRLIEDGHEVAAVITATERRRGRSPFAALKRVIEARGLGGTAFQVGGLIYRKLRSSVFSFKHSATDNFKCAEEVARAHSIQVFAPKRLEENWLISRVKELSCDLTVICFCTQTLPGELITASTHGTVNMHRSLLPAYAGPRPVFWALYHDEKETGVTIHRVVEKIDAGEILAQTKIAVSIQDDENSLKNKLLLAGVDLLSASISQIEQGKCSLKALPNIKASYFGRPTQKDIAELKELIKKRRAS